MADMVPDKIEPAKGVRGAPDDAAGKIVLAQIADEAERPSARGGDLAYDRVDPSLIDVHHPDRGTLAGEAERSGPSHPGGRRRDDTDLPVETHGLLLPLGQAARSLPS